ncbi:MAG: hypothetical protein QNJ65_07325 [Xenococcaceae cyanobacterium MO_234.B1]|nr:hypothetical protein [Xenococcaceae cyanobacterium MO_234.B1]
MKPWSEGTFRDAVKSQHESEKRYKRLRILDAPSVMATIGKG